MKTILIAGLGNPGKKYAKTRHNAGFMFVDWFHNANRENFSDWEFKKKLNAEISIGKIGEKKIILAKPQTFMNLSGESVKATLKYFIRGETSNSLIVVHDEIDLPLGNFRFSKDSSAAGHKGAQNIIDQLGTKNFTRLRIGVDNRDNKKSASSADKIPTEKYVLEKFSKEEFAKLSETIEQSIQKLSAGVIVLNNAK